MIDTHSHEHRTALGPGAKQSRRTIKTLSISAIVEAAFLMSRVSQEGGSQGKNAGEGRWQYGDKTGDKTGRF